jgi:hypothetical protein
MMARFIIFYENVRYLEPLEQTMGNLGQTFNPNFKTASPIKWYICPNRCFGLGIGKDVNVNVIYKNMYLCLLPQIIFWVNNRILS